MRLVRRHILAKLYSKYITTICYAYGIYVVPSTDACLGHNIFTIEKMLRHNILSQQLGPSVNKHYCQSSCQLLVLLKCISGNGEQGGRRCAWEGEVR